MAHDLPCGLRLTTGVKRHDIRCHSSSSIQFTNEASKSIESPVLPDQRTYAVVGSGALGGFYGARLQAGGCQVHFLVNSDYQHVKQHGLRIKSKDGDFDLPKVHAYPSVSAMPQCDVVILALKTTSNHLLPSLLPPLLKPGGVVLVLQNGIGIEPQVAQLVGEEAVVGGGCLLCSNKIAAGYIHHIDYGEVLLADYSSQYAPCGLTPRLTQLRDDFSAAGVPVRLEEDLFIARWKKLLWNIPYNGPSALLSATTDQIMGNPHLRKVSCELMEEVLLAAAASAKHLTPHLPPRVIDPSFADFIVDFTDKMNPYKPSMLLDYSAARPMEVEAMYGNPLRLAQQAGVETPRLAMMYNLLSFMDQGNRSSG